ncbi:unnamed protein product [Pleuronectes platessa]|uniref:Uncharacterized protein n=1 Tax=Pleuronectes platessa TaxID=8262 RepID=A0A9N7UEJ0_PLEPL|nr:unnamed protein product [Pleuronectes platessa]
MGPGWTSSSRPAGCSLLGPEHLWCFDPEITGLLHLAKQTGRGGVITQRRPRPDRRAGKVTRSICASTTYRLNPVQKWVKGSDPLICLESKVRGEPGDSAHRVQRCCHSAGGFLLELVYLSLLQTPTHLRLQRLRRTEG